MAIVEAAVVEEELIVERTGSLGRLRLNRPKALNSLTLGMVRAMHHALDGFLRDPGIAAVLVTGEGDRGLCAGGDIRAIHASGLAHDGMAETFWREEFLLNAAISHYPKQYIAFMDGITMGGGVGISSHGRHRIVTERTRLAMPETGIGYFPDVGATWLLSRAPGEFGTFLGLTGRQIGAGDAIAAGLADTFVASADLPGLIAALAAVPPGDGASGLVAGALRGHSRPPPPGDLDASRAAIDRLFVFDEVETILAALAAEEGDFAAATRETLLTRSPTSLKLTLRLLRLGRSSARVEECLERELGACARILSTPDFYEGIRAAVIDKDRDPHWSPAALADVSDDMLDTYFRKPAPPLFGGLAAKAAG